MKRDAVRHTILRREDDGGMLAIGSKKLADAPLGSRWRCGYDVATLRGIMVWDGPDDEVWRVRVAVAMLDVEGGARRTVSWTWGDDGTGEMSTVVAFADAAQAWEDTVAEALSGELSRMDGETTLTLHDGRKVHVGVQTVHFERREGDVPAGLSDKARLVSIIGIGGLDTYPRMGVWVLCDAEGRVLAQYEGGEEIREPGRVALALARGVHAIRRPRRT